MKAMRLVLTALLTGVVHAEEPAAPDAVSRFRLYDKNKFSNFLFYRFVHQSKVYMH